MSVKIAMAQFAAGSDKAINLTTICEGIKQAASSGASLVIFPENAMYSDPEHSPERRKSAAEPLTGRFVEQLAAAAQAEGIAVLAGMTEMADGDERSFNTLVYITPSDGLAAHYRKLHLYDAFGYRESDTVIPAEHAAPVVFTVGDVKFGAMTCYDLRFPEMGRFLADAGVDAIVAPAAWVAGPVKEMHWEILLRARAIENVCFVIGVGQTGPLCTGLSMVVDPMGLVIASAYERPEVALATINAQRVRDVRVTNPSLTNRRFDVVPRRQPVAVHA